MVVCLYPINVKTAEPIGPNFFEGHYVTFKSWKSANFFYEIRKQNSISNKFSKTTKFFHDIREFCCCFCFKMYTKRTCSQFKKKMGAKRPKSLVSLKFDLLMKIKGTVDDISSDHFAQIAQRSRLFKPFSQKKWWKYPSFLI